MRHAWVLACGLVATASGWAQNQGLSSPGQAPDAARWQARVEREFEPGLGARVGTPLWLLDLGRPRTLRLLGDYQFNLLRLGDTGGLRLTGGLLLSTRGPALGGGAAEASASNGPVWGSGYAGVGYASGGARGDWGFSADLGLSAFGFGPAAPSAGVHSLGLRDPRPGTVLRLGMSLSF